MEMMRVTVQLRQDAAMELQQSGESSASQLGSDSQQLLATVAELGGRLAPVHPGQTHPLLVTFFVVEVPNRQTAEELINRLQQLNVVEAAYLNPNEQLP
jgi:hypothetical protein